MGAKFEHWLARPATLRMLRFLIADEKLCHSRYETTSSSLQRRKPCGQRNFTSGNLKQGATSILDIGIDQDEHRFRYSRPHTSRRQPDDVPLPNKLDQSFEFLRFQADVNQPAPNAKRLVDLPEHANDYTLWIKILQFRERVHGEKGVLEVWHGMRKRQIDLPTDGPNADALWKGFIYNSRVDLAGQEEALEEHLLPKVVQYAKGLKERVGSEYVDFASLILGRVLRFRPALFHVYLKKLEVAQLLHRSTLTKIADDILLSVDVQRARRVFTQSYAKIETDPCYDLFIKASLSRENLRAALGWHRIFIKNGDLPSEEFAASKEVRHLYELSSKSSDNLEGLPLVKNESAPFTRASMNEIMGEVHGIKPREFSDNFCARIFATSAFSLEFAIRSLHFLGVEAIGPLSLRELALRTISPQDFCSKLEALKGAGIQIATTIYSRLLLQVTREDQSHLFKTLLESDQHPESYDDVVLQQSLLTAFLKTGDFAKVDLTLSALSMHGQYTSQGAWNSLLQHYVSDQNRHNNIPRLLHQMQAQVLPLTTDSLNQMLEALLPPRRKSKRPVLQPRPSWMDFDPVDLLANAAVYSQKLGEHAVPFSLWKEVLRRYGMEHRFDEVKRLTFWLADYMARNGGINSDATEEPTRIVVNSLSANSPTSTQISRRELETIRKRVFTTQFRQALFTWGFRAAGKRNQLIPKIVGSNCAEDQPWAQGLVLLRDLKDMGLSVKTIDVREAITLRLWILFGPAYSTLAINNEIKRQNQISLVTYIRQANEIWDHPLFAVDESLLLENEEGSPSNETMARLQQVIFGEYRLVGKKRREFVRVGEWASQRPIAHAQYRYIQTHKPGAQSILWKHATRRQTYWHTRVRIPDSGHPLLASPPFQSTHTIEQFPTT